MIFGQRQYAMRIWINPQKLQQQGLDAGDVVTALQEQNAEVAAGSIGAPPATEKPALHVYRSTRSTQLSDPEAVRQHHPARQSQRRLRAPGRRRPRRARRQKLHERLRFNGKQSRRPGRPAILPTANALDVSQARHARDGRSSPRVPDRRALQGRLRLDDVRATNRSKKSS